MSILESTETDDVVEFGKGLVARAEELRQCVITLSGPESSLAKEFQDICFRFSAEWRKMAANRGLKLPTVAFVGEAGSGKTTLVRMLAGLPDAGYEPKEEGHGHLRWYGPEQPLAMAHGVEEWQRIPTEAMADFGASYMLLDTPALGTGLPLAEEGLRSAFASACFKVLVVDARRIEAAMLLKTLAKADGSVVLPVIHLTSALSKETCPALHDLEKDVATMLHELGNQMPGATILEPVYLPDFEGTGDPDAARANSSEDLVNALRRMVAEHPLSHANRRPELEASWRSFERNAGIRLNEMLSSERIRETHGRLEKKLQSMQDAVVSRLSSDQGSLKAIIRLDLRSALVGNIPLLAFPFRTLAGLLCLTVGAWDRLVLALGGSLPSAFLVAHAGFHGKKQEADAVGMHRRDLEQRIARIARSEVSEELVHFRDAVAKNFDSLNSDSGTAPEFEVKGVDQLAAAWQEALQGCSKVARESGRGWVRSIAAFGALIFWALFSGPLIHSYGQYVPAVLRSMGGNWTSKALADYPSMGGGFWLTALILSTIPVFLIALILVATRLSNRKVLACLNQFESTIRGDVANDVTGLEVSIIDPKVKAYRHLMNIPRFHSTER